MKARKVVANILVDHFEGSVVKKGDLMVFATEFWKDATRVDHLVVGWAAVWVASSVGS